MAYQDTIKDLFEYQEADEPSVEDDAWVLKTDENVSIQICQDGTFGVTCWVEEEEAFHHSPNYENVKDAMKTAVKFRDNLGEA